MIYDHETGRAYESGNTYFQFGLFLLGACSYLLPLLLEEQYGKMELKYFEGDHCQSVLHPQRIFNIPVILLIKWRPVPFKMVCHTRCCELRNYHYKIVSVVHINSSHHGLKNQLPGASIFSWLASADRRSLSHSGECLFKTKILQICMCACLMNKPTTKSRDSKYANATLSIHASWTPLS